jgi:hypothetical protein
VNENPSKGWLNLFLNSRCNKHSFRKRFECSFMTSHLFSKQDISRTFQITEEEFKEKYQDNKRLIKCNVFWDIAPYSLLKVSLSFGGIYGLQLRGGKINRTFHVISCSVYSSTPKFEAICSSEISVDFQRTTRRYIAEYNILHNHRCEKFNF